MAKTKPKVKAKAKKTPSLILQHDLHPTLDVVDRNVMRGHHPTRYTDANQRTWAEAALNQDVKLKMKDKIVLSAARTVVSGKAWLNASSCRNIYSGEPAIEFLNDRSDYYGGQLQFWLENLSGPKNLQFVIRMTGANTGGATITVGSSFPTSFTLVPVSIGGSMNLTLGNVLQVPENPSGGLGLLTLEVHFHDGQYGSWRFIDVTITEAT